MSSTPRCMLSGAQATHRGFRTKWENPGEPFLCSPTHLLRCLYQRSQETIFRRLESIRAFKIFVRYLLWADSVRGARDIEKSKTWSKTLESKAKGVNVEKELCKNIL